MKNNFALSLLFSIGFLHIVKANFRCKNGQLIPSSKFCDLIVDCSDGSDELASRNSLNYVKCNNSANIEDKVCSIDMLQACEGNVKCINASKCDFDCPNYYRCQKTGDCVSRATICDGKTCDGCPEDHGWPNGVGFKCLRDDRNCVLPQQLVWDGVPDCDGGADLCFSPGQKKVRIAGDFRNLNTSSFDEDKCFQCLHDDTIIQRTGVCDGVFDCPDMSDECLCNEAPKICENVVRAGSENPNTSCKAGDLQCNDGSCVSRSSVCDGKVQCPQAEDEEFSVCQGTKPCSNATSEDKLCRCKPVDKCVPQLAVPCNGLIECTLGFGMRWAFSPGFPNDECDAQCGSSRRLNCTNATILHIKISSIHCKKTFREPEVFITVQHPNGSSFQQLKFGLTSVLNYNITSEEECDGYVDCDDQDEKYCPDRFNCSARSGTMVSIHNVDVCDGFVDCDDGSDESEMTCAGKRFYCPSLGGRKISIDKNSVCDARIACDNQDDERNCTNDGRFYCEGGKPLFVPERKLFDGRIDCVDWSDECPSNPSSDHYEIFHSRYQMVKYASLRLSLWFKAILALTGNTIVIIHTVRRRYRERNLDLPANLTANCMLILNLAIADFLMGIYLLALGVAAIHMKGYYCVYDLPWRSGQTCKALGVLSVVATESSVITMIHLTASRLHAVNKPFLAATRPKRSELLISIATSWIVPVIIALTPLITGLEYYFIYQVIFPNNPFSLKTTLDLDSTRRLAATALTFDLAPNVSTAAVKQVFASISFSSWKDLQIILNKYSAHKEYYLMTNYFGYYSINSVCFPNFFVTASDRAWGFSLLVTFFNFFAFMFVACSYAWIYFIAQKHNDMRSPSSASNPYARKRTKRMRSKICRLVFSDFCCWMPVCIIAFCKLSGAHIDHIAYSVAAIILLPINSALNPILYSDLLDKFYRFFRKKIECSKADHPTNENTHEET